ncbi:MAG TPA: epoxyqueuosine reductase QueH, partial [Candidatus Omnitrophota bacterium]|nr:epoxyqueuosine reductase QueH [Candidatus Omnitrophota bacterium]
MKKVLLHICCGPCAIYPVNFLRQEGFEVEGFFYNPNIHPFSEYEKRYDAVLKCGERLGLGIIYHKYDLEHFLKEISCITDR